MMPTLQGAITRGATLHLRLLQSICRRRSLPLIYWRIIHKIVGVVRREDPLFPTEPPVARGARLRSRELAELLHDDVLGDWSLDAMTIDLLWDELLRVRPRAIIECGSGVSTLVFAKYAQLFAGSEPVAVLSIEQNASYKDKVEHRLKETKINRYAQILYAPLTDQYAYAIDPTELSGRLGEAKADLVLIDGPSGPPGCRVRTLPVLAPSCRVGTTWLLDDAFRDGELGALANWSRCGGVRVNGIYPTGKGLARGVIRDVQALSLQAVTELSGQRAEVDRFRRQNPARLA